MKVFIAFKPHRMSPVLHDGEDLELPYPNSCLLLTFFLNELYRCSIRNADRPALLAHVWMIMQAEWNSCRTWE